MQTPLGTYWLSGNRINFSPFKYAVRDTTGTASKIKYLTIDNQIGQQRIRICFCLFVFFQT